MSPGILHGTLGVFRTRGRGSVARSVKFDLDLLADQEAARLQRLAPTGAVRLAVDGGLAVEGDRLICPVAAPGAPGRRRRARSAGSRRAA